MKVLFTADWHVHPSNHINTEPAIQHFVRYAEETNPDLIIHGGDVFETRGRIDPKSVLIVRRAFGRLASISDVLVVPGNHDAANAWDEIDSATAVLDGTSTDGVFGTVSGVGHDVKVATRPDTFKLGGALVAAVPCPSKYHLMASDSEANLTEELGKVFRLLAVQVEMPGPNILVFHGGIAGVETESRYIQQVGQDVTIPREYITGAWDAVLCGHIHKRQTVGPAHYPGSLVPLNFSQAGEYTGFLELNIENGLVDYSFNPVPIARPFFTVDIDLGAELQPALSPYFKRAAYRFRIKGTEEQIVSAGWSRGAAKGLELPEGSTLRVELERTAVARVRSDVKADAPLRVILAEWLKLNPTEASTKTLVGMAEELDLGEPKKDRLEYRPQITSFTDFKQFAKGVIDWNNLPGVTCIKGANASGKTNSTRAEGFALYGVKALNGSPLSRAVREGSREARVEHIFEVGPDRYTIRRTVKLSKSGKATGDISLAVEVCGDLPADGLAWKSLNGADSRETQKKIEALVGSLDMYLATRICKQGEARAILEATPKDRMKILLGALQLGRFDLLAEKANNGRLVALRETETAEAILAGQRNALEALPGLEHKRDGIEAGLEIVTAAVVDKNEQLETAKEILAAELREQSVAKYEADKYIDLVQKQRTARERVESCEKEIEATKNTLEEADQVAEALEDLSELKESEAELIGQQVEHEKCSTAIVKTEGEIGRINRAHRRQVELTQNDLQNKQRASALLESVPCQTSVLFDGQAKAECKSCQFLLDAVAARDDIDPLEKGLQALLKADPSQDLALWLGDQIQGREAVGFNEEQLELIRKSIGESDPLLLSKAKKIEGATVRLTSEETRLTGLMADYEAISSDLDALKYEPRPTADASLRDIVKDAIAAADVAAELKQTADRDYGVVCGEIIALEATKLEVSVKEAELNDDRIKLSHWTTLAAAFGRDGVPFLILERALPQIETTANSLLEGTGLSIQVEPVRDLQSGESRDEVTILFMDANGSQVLEDASGAEGTFLGIAIRAALSELQADRLGVRPDSFIIDEGFGAFDPENIDNGRALVRRLAYKFGRVIFVTHIPEVQNIADLEVEVIPGPDGSNVEVSL